MHQNVCKVSCPLIPHKQGMSMSLLTFQGTVKSHHSVDVAHTCNTGGEKDPFLLPFISCPKTRKSHSSWMQEMKYHSLSVLPQNHNSNFLKCCEFSLPWSFLDCKENTWFSPKARLSGVLCMVENLLRMLLSGLGCPEILNYCYLSSGWTDNCTFKSGLWHLSQRERCLDSVFQKIPL